MPEQSAPIDPSISESRPRPRPVVLLLLDGWGIAPAGEANAFITAKTPNFLSLIKEYPVALIAPGAKSRNARYLTIGTGQELVSEDSESAVTLTSVLAAAGLIQSKISETERFAALTHYFNGQAGSKADREDWKIISSETGDKSVKPFLAFKRSVQAIIKEVESAAAPDFIVAAIPYLDLVAQSGDLAVVKKAIEAVDKYLRRIVTAIESKNGVLIISATAGNVERIRNLGVDLVDTEMTDNPVPLIIVGRDYKGKTIGLAEPLDNDLSVLAPAGTLADLAPTILRIIGLDQPPEMTGKSLLDKK